MERLLTTRDLQNMLQVDRITIYRMLDSGELPGIKVGGQWRFPEQAVSEWLQGIKARQSAADAVVCAVPSAPAFGELPDRAPRLTELVSTVCLQNVQDGFAEAVGVASLVIDLDGTPLTGVSNGCEFCRLGRTSAEFRRRCSASWASLAHVEEDHPEVHLCHAGIGYAVAPITVHGMRMGLVVGGQFWSDSTDHEKALERTELLAIECGVSARSLTSALDGIPVYTAERVFLVTKLLATIANTLSEIGFQGYEVRRKLQQIAEIVKSL